VTKELGQKIQNLDGLGLKITILYFLEIGKEFNLSSCSDTGKNVQR
jgi:hypothetical protein